jgi:glucose-1-phosphate adenylyltransferase
VGGFDVAPPLRLRRSTVYSPCCPRPQSAVPAIPAAAPGIATFILAGGEGTRLGVLTAERPKPVLPFAGHHRLIDFTLSNCVDSGLSTIGVLTQYLSDAIARYVGGGAPWSLDGDGAELHVLPSGTREYSGTADAVHQNLGHPAFARASTVVVLAADHVYRMDYRAFLAHHAQTGADVTLAVVQVPRDDASRFGVVHLDAAGRVVEFEEKPPEPTSTLVSMGIYVFNAAVLRRLLTADAAGTGTHDFGRDILPRAVSLGLRVQAYAFDGFWRDVGTPASYWDAHREFLNDADGLGLGVELRCARGPGVQHIEFGEDATVRESMIFGGCAVHGLVERSLLAPGVHVAPGAVVRDSVLLRGSRVETGAIVEHAILDEGARVGRFAMVGTAPPRPSDFAVDDEPVSIVAARGLVRPGQLIWRGGVVRAGRHHGRPAADARAKAYVA